MDTSPRHGAVIRFRPPVPTLPPPVPSLPSQPSPLDLPNFLESPKSSILSVAGSNGSNEPRSCVNGNSNGIHSYPRMGFPPWSPSLRSPSSGRGSPVKPNQTPTSPLLGFRERPTPGCLWRKAPATPPDEPPAPPESDDSEEGAEAPEETTPAPVGVQPLPEKVPQLPRPKQSGRPSEKSAEDEVSDAEAPPEEEVSKPFPKLEAKKSSERCEASPSDQKKASKKPLTKKPSKPSVQNVTFGAADVEKPQNSEKDFKPTPGVLLAAPREGAKESVAKSSPASFLSDSESEADD